MQGKTVLRLYPDTMKNDSAFTQVDIRIDKNILSEALYAGFLHRSAEYRGQQAETGRCINEHRSNQESGRTDSRTTVCHEVPQAKKAVHCCRLWESRLNTNTILYNNKLKIHYDEKTNCISSPVIFLGMSCFNASAQFKKFNLGKAIQAGKRCRTSNLYLTPTFAAMSKEYMEWMDKHNPLTKPDSEYGNAWKRLTGNIKEVDGMKVNLLAYMK